MAKGNRKVPPACMRHIINSMHESGNLSKIIVTVNQLVDTLFKNGWGTKANCLQIVQQCVRDGFLVAQPNKSRNLRLPTHKEIGVGTSDKYCFECHLPGELISCMQCLRSFHSGCVRRNPERSKQKVNFSNAFKKQFPNYDSDSTEENTKDTEPEAHTELIGTNESIRNTVIDLSDSSEDESKHFDVVCLGLVRPPTRTRAVAAEDTSLLKREIEDETTEELEYKLCTCCRLMKIAALRQPPELDSEELCYLLNFSFKSHRFRVKTEISNYFIKMKLSPSEIDIICRLLFINPKHDLKWIETKLAKKEYKFLLEFQVDLLDLQHAIGVFYGTDSVEYLAVSYFERFVYYDLSEISRCPDCFRHGIEKHTKFWFAKPCLQRHEIVFAKMRNYPYWPAKVLRVLHHNRYDVRFFGGKHERALVPIANIRSNDHIISSKDRSKLMEAIKEMRLYHSLSFYSPCIFSYRADKSQMEELILCFLDNNNDNNNSIEETEKEKPSSIKRPRRSCKAKPVVSSITGGQPFAIRGNSSQEIEAISNNVNLNESTIRAINVHPIEHYLLENQALREENENLKQKLNKCLAEQNEIKKKQWCLSCLKEVGNKVNNRYSFCSIACRTKNKSKHKYVP